MAITKSEIPSLIYKTKQNNAQSTNYHPDTIKL